jgi:predicted transcriptional regulator
MNGGVQMPLDDFPNMRVKDVMTTKVITVGENQSRQQAARLLTQHRISGLPVVNDDQVAVGVVTEYDIISKDGPKVRDIMTRGAISVGEDTDLEEVGHLLVQKRIKRLLVLDEGKLVGIVSRSDLVKEIAQHWVCHVCGEVTHSEVQPELCPRCGARETIASTEPVPPGS